MALVCRAGHAHTTEGKDKTGNEDAGGAVRRTSSRLPSPHRELRLGTRSLNTKGGLSSPQEPESLVPHQEPRTLPIEKHHAHARLTPPQGQDQ
ncbi:hypothetical protein E2C01_018438 [Portunus trituberculatus]|uniref:Uncharacterized protein n=1 Tax=Portunus trituberculatus TaxID=210409 RepID=A0A5B7DUH3_PORTR|nr:hypothetical protein [Portunus trituberculatus]